MELQAAAIKTQWEKHAARNTKLGDGSLLTPSQHLTIFSRVDPDSHTSPILATENVSRTTEMVDGD
jgi:hypothetical protein